MALRQTLREHRHFVTSDRLDLETHPATAVCNRMHLIGDEKLCRPRSRPGRQPDADPQRPTLGMFWRAITLSNLGHSSCPYYSKVSEVKHLARYRKTLLTEQSRTDSNGIRLAREAEERETFWPILYSSP